MDQANAQHFLQPQWFFPLFICMWLGMSAFLSRVGGWSRLARHFRAEGPRNGETFRFVSGSMGAKAFPVHYGSCLLVTVNESGFFLSILFPFRFQNPQLFIPWSQVESVEEKSLLLARRTVIHLHSHWPVISVRGRAGQFIQETYARVSSQKSR